MAGARRRPEPDRLRILVSNDDGYRAEGLHRLSFDNGALTYEDTLGIFPTSLSVIDVGRIQ